MDTLLLGIRLEKIGDGMKMAFCLGSRIIANRPLTDYLKKAVLYFNVIELQADPRYFSPNYTLTVNEKKIIRIYQERYGFQLTMHAPFEHIRLGAIDFDERQLAINIFLNTIRTAADLNINLITFHPCAIEPDKPGIYHENCLLEEGSLSILLTEAKKLGITLLMENMPSTPGFHPKTCDGSRFQELLWLFTGPEFGLTIDIGHALQAKVPLESLLKMDRIRQFHFHENEHRLDRHSPFKSNLDWWEKTVKTIAKKFPHSAAILEMSSLEDQIESLHQINHLLGRPTAKLNQKPIPPMFFD
jgi:sugar phosphate isomerase/epimerase